MGDVTIEAQVLGDMSVTLAYLGDLVGRQSYQKESLATYHRLNSGNPCWNPQNGLREQISNRIVQFNLCSNKTKRLTDQNE